MTMLTKEETLIKLRNLLRNNEAPMFFAELRRLAPSASATTHFYVRSDSQKGAFEVSFRLANNIKSIQGFLYFGDTEVLRGYSLDNNVLTLRFGDEPITHCSCPIAPAVGMGLRCPYCGLEMGSSPAVTQVVNQPAANSSFPTVEEVLRDAYDAMSHPLISSKVQLLTNTLHLDEQEVLKALAITQEDYERDAIYKRSLELFGHDLSQPLSVTILKNFSWADYIEVVKPYMHLKFGVCASTNLSHEWFIQTLAPHVSSDITIRLELYSHNVVYVDSLYTTNPDFVQDFGWLFGRCYNESSGEQRLTLAGFSYNLDGGYANFTRVPEVVAALPYVYDSTIRLTELIKTTAGIPLYAGSLVDVVDVEDSGLFVVSPAANHAVKFKIPHTFKGDSR